MTNAKRYWEQNFDGFGKGSNMSSDISILWTPPMAYQQSVILPNISSSSSSLSTIPDIALFPLELSLKDYLRRLFDVIELSLQKKYLVDPDILLMNNLKEKSAASLGAIGTPASLNGKRTSMVKAMLVSSGNDTFTVDQDIIDISTLLRAIIAATDTCKRDMKTGDDEIIKTIMFAALRLQKVLVLSRRPDFMSGRLICIDILF